jgi:hypothetical protein
MPSSHDLVSAILQQSARKLVSCVQLSSVASRAIIIGSFFNVHASCLMHDATAVHTSARIMLQSAHQHTSTPAAQLNNSNISQARVCSVRPTLSLSFVNHWGEEFAPLRPHERRRLPHPRSLQQMVHSSRTHSCCGPPPLDLLQPWQPSGQYPIASPVAKPADESIVGPLHGQLHMEAGKNNLSGQEGMGQHLSFLQIITELVRALGALWGLGTQILHTHCCTGIKCQGVHPFGFAPIPYRSQADKSCSMSTSTPVGVHVGFPLIKYRLRACEVIPRSGSLHNCSDFFQPLGCILCMTR